MRSSFLALGLLALGYCTTPVLAQEPDLIWGESGPDTVIRLQDFDDSGLYIDNALDLKIEYVDGVATAGSTYACTVDLANKIVYYYDRSNFGLNPKGDGVFRARDLNNNGKMDYAEINAYWPGNGSDLGSTPDLLFDSLNRVVVACDTYVGGTRGLYVLRDLNANGRIDLGLPEEVLLTGPGTTLATTCCGAISVDNIERVIEDTAGFYIFWEQDDLKLYRVKDVNANNVLDAGEVSLWLDTTTIAGLLPGTTSIQSLRVDKGAGPAGRDVFYIGSYSATGRVIVRAIDDGSGGGTAGNNAIEAGEASLWADLATLGIAPIGPPSGFVGDFAIFNNKVYVQVNVSATSLNIWKLSDNNANGVIDGVLGGEYATLYQGPSAFIDEGTFCAIPDGTFKDICNINDQYSPSCLISVNPPTPGTATAGLAATPDVLPVVNPGDTIQFEFSIANPASEFDFATYPFGLVLFSGTPLGPTGNLNLPGTGGCRTAGIKPDTFFNLGISFQFLFKPNPATGVTLPFPVPGSLGGTTLYYVGINYDGFFNFGRTSQVNAAIFN